MASSLNHPHILTVYDTGEFDGRQYLATEFVDGGTLKNWAQQQPRSWEDVAELLTGVADGLATAHQAGILHRDIKPDNILVTASGYAKLADFGLAKLEAGSQPADITRTIVEEQTQQGIIVGTIAYMSPEQAAGKTLDARSDMFSFGVVLYEMLAGNRPFKAATNLELLQQVIHGTPPPLSDDVPEPLRVLVARALEKDPAKRYSSMRELVTALRAAQRPSRQGPAAPASRSSEMAGRGRVRCHRTRRGRRRSCVLVAACFVHGAVGVHTAYQLHRFRRISHSFARWPHARLPTGTEHLRRPRRCLREIASRWRASSLDPRRRLQSGTRKLLPRWFANRLLASRRARLGPFRFWAVSRRRCWPMRTV